MSESESGEAATSSTSSEIVQTTANMNHDDDDDIMNPPKRRRTDNIQPNVEKLEQRLGGILSCVVCLDLPKSAVYQCIHGHLMCSGCFTHVLADARLRDETATCPNCRVEISKVTASKNLAVEKAISELPASCQFCNEEFPRNVLTKHEETECDDRITGCKYSRLGCPWKGPAHESQEHENVCSHPNRRGIEILEALILMDQRHQEEKTLYAYIFELLSYEKIAFNDLQMKPYRTDEYVHRLYYETARFLAFGHQWVVKARINNNNRDPALCSERDLTFQLILKSKATSTISINYLVVRGPAAEVKVKPKIYKFDFTDAEPETPYLVMPLPDTAECNRLLSSKTINFRLIMFQASNS